MSGSIDPNRFNKSVVETVAKRAANRCSNPDCGATTSGPADEHSKSVNVGEAAHIFGAKPNSARYSAEMSPIERSSITNAIWLCCNCHTIIDADPISYSSDLLFEWRSTHEENIRQQIGKTGERLRHKLLEQELEPFNTSSRLTKQIILDKPYAQEFRLTAELLRTMLSDIFWRSNALKKSLYSYPIININKNDCLNWMTDRTTEMLNIVSSLNGVLNTQFTEAWGPPGQPGSSMSILRSCVLLQEACKRLLLWEESIRFTSLSPEFDGVHKLLIGIGNRLLDQVSIVQNEMNRIFSIERPEGQFKIEVVFDLPDQWEAQMLKELRFYSKQFRC